MGAAIVGLAVAGAILLAAWPAQGAEPVCIDAETREQARVLMLAGIDQALREHALKMFNVWMKDPAKQPQRANAGMRSALVAYSGARAAAQRWTPPACSSATE